MGRRRGGASADLAGEVHDAAHALNGQVVTRQVGGLGVAAERSDGRGDDVGLVRRKGCPVEPELCHEAGFEVVEHDVAVRASRRANAMSSASLRSSTIDRLLRLMAM